METKTHRTTDTQRNMARTSFETTGSTNSSLGNDDTSILTVRTIALLGILIIIVALVVKG